jgi:hypothetical protein
VLLVLLLMLAGSLPVQPWQQPCLPAQPRVRQQVQSLGPTSGGQQLMAR